MIERSYGLAQIAVKVNSITDNNVYVTDSRGIQYPPIPTTALWGSGASPQVGETWMMVKDNGRWMLKARAVPVLPQVDGASLASQALVKIGLAALAPADTPLSGFLSESLPVSVALGSTPTLLMTVGPLAAGVWALWATFTVSDAVLLTWALPSGVSITGGATSASGTGSLTLISTLTATEDVSVDIDGEWTSAGVTVSVGGYLAFRVA